MSKLLQILSENAEFTVDELASITGMAISDVEKEISKLKEDGIIKGYQAIVDWSKVENSDTTAFIELKVTPQKDKGFDEIASILAEYKEVSDIYLMAGSYDLLLTVKGKTINDISNFVARKIATMDGIVSTSTHFQLNVYKEKGVVILEDESNKDFREQVL